MQSTVLVLAWGYPVLSAFVVKTAIALLGKVGILWKGLWSGVCVVYFPSCSIHLYVSPEFLRENLHLAFPSFWSNIPKLLAPCSASRACAVAGTLLRLSCCLRYDSPDGQDALPSQGHHFYHTYKTLCHVNSPASGTEIHRDHHWFSGPFLGWRGTPSEMWIHINS